MSKTFKDWYQNEIIKEEVEQEKTQSAVAIDDAVIKKVEAVVEEKKSKKGKKSETEKISELEQKVISTKEFTPSWRDKSPQDFDKAAHQKNTGKLFQLYFIYALLLIGISIGSYLIWENYIQGNVNKIDSNPLPSDNDNEETPQPVQNKKVEITYFMVEIGTSGSRQVKSEEVKTECGDILVPVTEELTFETASIDEDGNIKDISLLDASLVKLLSFVEKDFDVEKKLVNSLADSNLKVSKVIKINTEYVVELEGEVNVIGVCDVERVLGQIENTAERALPDKKITFKLNGSADEYDKIRESVN